MIHIRQLYWPIFSTLPKEVQAKSRVNAKISPDFRIICELFTDFDQFLAWIFFKNFKDFMSADKICVCKSVSTLIFQEHGVIVCHIERNWPGCHFSETQTGLGF